MNLYLRVLGRRADGYHLIDSVIVPVSLYDEIEITKPKGKKTKAGKLTVTCDDPMVPSGESNLAYQAASLLFREKRVVASIHIHIRKKIPVGGGLGGGSSDAAATLRGLSRLLGLRCPQEELLSLAASLGADVPFFIKRCPARVGGIGELITPLSSLPRLWMVVLYPGFPVSTRWVYENLKLTKGIENTSINFPLRDLDEIQRLLVNDLESVTLGRHPEVGLLKKRLVQEGAHGALMAGSGSSVFGIFLHRERAREAFNRLRKEKNFETFFVRSLG